ncbi:MAG: hypothetical protein ABJ370_12265 [Paracoccaceae bacterium]
MIEITDQKSAKAWLESQDHQTRVWFAARCALRAFPAIGLVGHETIAELAFVSLRAMLISGAASTCPPPEMTKLKKASASADPAFPAALSAADYSDVAAQSAAYTAANVAYTALTATAHVHSSTHSAALAAHFAADAARAHSAALALDNAHSAADAAAAANAANSADTFSAADSAYSAAAYSAAQSDKENKMQWPKLWHSADTPVWLAEGWTKLKAFMEADPKVWRFWLEWYEGILNGTPLPWDLTFQIATSLTEEDWEAGPESVANRIKELQDHFWSEALPQHEKIQKDQETGKYDVLPEIFDPDLAVEGWLQQIELFLEICTSKNSNDVSFMHIAYLVLDHTVKECRNDPNAIAQNVAIAHDQIVTDLKSPQFSSDETVVALVRVLDEVRTQIVADHPEVRRSWESRVAQKLREVDAETRVLAIEAVRKEAERAQNRLKIDYELDAEVFERGDSVEAQATALRRSTGRAAKTNLLERASDATKKLDASAGYKATKIGTTGWGLVQIVRTIFGG